MSAPSEPIGELVELTELVETLKSGERRSYERPLSKAADARIRANLRSASSSRTVWPIRGAAVALTLGALFLSAHALSGDRRGPEPRALVIASQDVGSLGDVGLDANVPAPVADGTGAWDAPPGPSGPSELP